MLKIVYISDADVTLMTAAQLEQLVLGKRNHMKASVGVDLFFAQCGHKQLNARRLITTFWPKRFNNSDQNVNK